MHLNREEDIAEQFQFTGQNIRTNLQHWVEKHPDKIFFHWHPFTGKPDSWSYGRFWEAVKSIAVGLQNRGVNAGDRVLIHSDNCPEMVVTWYACAAIGAVAVTTNTGAVPHEMAHYIKKADPIVAITQPKYIELLTEFKDKFRWMAVMDNDSGEPAEVAITADFFPFADLHGDSDQVQFADSTVMSPAGIVYTSGTTGLPKAVLHSHGNFLWAGFVGPNNIDFRPDCVMLTYLPFFHINAQLWCTAIVLGMGGSMVLLPRVSVSRFWSLVQRYGITHLAGLPLLVQGATPDVPAEHSVRHIGLGEIPELSKQWHTRITSTYGSSEVVAHVLASSYFRQWPDNAMGRPTPGYQVQLVKPDSGEVCRPGEIGELWIKGTRGLQVFLEYFNDEEATANSFAEGGWYKSGDLIRLGEDGHFYYMRRLKDMVKVGGENVGADEVEGVILALPEVKEAAVVGKSDEALDEVIVAYVIGDNSLAETELAEKIMATCREKLAKFKVPRHVCIVEDFPRALLNKVSKPKLKEMAELL